MHPFTNQRGEHRDRYEILRTGESKKKRSAHVSYHQLVEMYAHGCFDQFNIRLRMKPSGSAYPSDAPALHPHSDDIVPGSDFARDLAKVDIRAPLSAGVKEVLCQLAVRL